MQDESKAKNHGPGGIFLGQELGGSASDLVSHFPSEAQFFNLQMGTLGEWFISKVLSISEILGLCVYRDDLRSCFGVSMPRDAHSPRPQAPGVVGTLG